MNCLNQTVVLFSALSTYCCGGGGLEDCTYRPLWLDVSLGPLAILFAIGCSPCHSGSVIVASRAIQRARAGQARNRLETVWSLSEFDKIGDGVLHLFADLQRSRRLERLDFYFCSPPQTPSTTFNPRVATLRQKYFWDKRCESFFSCSLSADSSLCTGR